MNKISILDNYNVETTVTDKLYRVGRLMRTKANGFFKTRGVVLTAEQWGLLVRLSENEGRPQGALASRIFLDYANVTRLVDKLEKRKLIRRASAPNDRRSHLLYLTKAGKTLVERLLPEVIEAKAAFYRGFDERDIKRLSDMLSTIEENLIGK